MAGSRSITLTLGRQQQVLDALVSSGEYDSASEAVRAALRALERERDAVNAIWREKVREALEDSRPRVPAEKVFADLRAFHDEQVRADGRGL